MLAARRHVRTALVAPALALAGAGCSGSDGPSAGGPVTPGESSGAEHAGHAAGHAAH
jgi:hypothetical protein